MPSSAGAPARSLADELRSWPDERLAALLQARPDLATPVPSDLGVLTARASVRLSVLRALEQLDAFSLALLDGLVVLDEPATLAGLHGLVGKPATKAQVRAALDRLRDLALVWGEDTGLRLVSAVREVLSASPAGLGRPVAVLLGRATDRALAPVAESLGLPPEAGLPGVLDVLTDPARLGAVLAEATDDARQVLARLAAGPPLGKVSDAARPVRAGEAGSAVRWLLARGLLVAVDDSTVELPREVGLAVRGAAPLGQVRPSPPRLETTDPGTGAVDRTAALTAFDVVLRTETLLTSWAASPASVLRSGGLGVREVKRLAKELDVPEATAGLLVEVAAAAGLVDQTPGVEPEWVPTPAFDAWLAQEPEQRWTTLARAWLDLPRLPGLVGQRDDRDKALNALAPELERPSAPAERRRLLQALAGAPAGTAPTRESLAALLVWSAPRRGGRLRDRLHAWSLDEAEALGLTGRGGLASFARHLLAGDEPQAARVLGDLLPAPLDHVLVQPDLTVVAPGPLERALAVELGLVADVESTGGATVYRVSEASVRRALDAGRTAEELHELFRTRSRTPVPQSLTYLVDDVARRHGRLRVGMASAYLRCDDEALLAEVVASKRTAPLRLRRLAPTVATSPAEVEEVLATLRTAGYAPAAEAPDGALLLARTAVRRTPLRPRTQRWAEPTMPAEQARLSVTALRAGDLAARATRRAPVTTTSTTARSSTADTLAFLQEAARAGKQVWLGYVDAQGRATSRVVEVRTVDGGWVGVWDHLRSEDRTFALHRITGVADVDDVTA